MLDDYTASLLCPCTYGLKRELGDIAKAVSREYVVPVGAISGVQRHRTISRARQAFFAKAFENGHTIAEIGRYANRDHTTVLHGIKAHNARQA